MKHPFAIALDLLRPGGGLHAAAREGEARELAWLLQHNIYDVNCYYDDITALYQATLENQPASIVILLKYQADPNLPNKKTEYSDKKPIQLFMYGNAPHSLNHIKMLVMHGATAEGLTFYKNGKAESALLVKMLQTKQNYDNYLQAANEYFVTHHYQESLVNYKQAADIWYNLSQKESIDLYKKYYHEKALAIYENAINCFEKLSAITFTSELKEQSQIVFEQAADCCNSLKLFDKTRLYSSKAANLYDGIQQYPYSSTFSPEAENLTNFYNSLGLFKRIRMRNQYEEQELPKNQHTSNGIL